jgi:16S rRNA (guanine1516-N2)-methyltransferase
MLPEVVHDSWCVCPVSRGDRDLAEYYAHTFALPIADSGSSARYSLALIADQGRLSLRDSRSRRVLIDDSPPRLFRVHRRDPLGRAVTPAMHGSAQTCAVVIDATAGLGTDTIALAIMGFQVVALERHPLVAALLSARLQQIDAKLAQRIEFKFTDACDFFADLSRACRHDGDTRTRMIEPRVIYLDPMYPQKRRPSALPSLELQTLRRLLGTDSSTGSLFHQALAAATRRVVVKRPRQASPLGTNPDGSHEGKLVRYDVYAKPAQ